MGGGQSAVADALHQMFLLPAVAVRLIGSEAVGFNLWVATPFPLAALGAWLFFRRRFAPDASALGAIAFSLSGPIVSTGNFPEPVVVGGDNSLGALGRRSRRHGADAASDRRLGAW